MRGGARPPSRHKKPVHMHRPFHSQACRWHPAASGKHFFRSQQDPPYPPCPRRLLSAPFDGVRRRRGAVRPGAPRTGPGTRGGAGGLGLPRPRPLAASPRRRPRPEAGQRPSSGGSPESPAPSPCSARGPLPSPKTPKGPVSRRRPAPLRNQARHRQPMRPSAAGGTRAKRRRTTGPPRRTWAWRTGCCPHGPGCRRARAAGCWSPSHAPRA